MFAIYGKTNDRAQLLAMQATASDIHTARLITAHYAGTGLVACIHAQADGDDDHFVEDWHPVPAPVWKRTADGRKVLVSSGAAR